MIRGSWVPRYVQDMKGVDGEGASPLGVVQVVELDILLKTGTSYTQLEAQAIVQVCTVFVCSWACYPYEYICI